MDPAQQSVTPEIIDPWIVDPLLPNDISFLLETEIGELHWLEQSLLMAQLSRLAYFGPDAINAIVAKAGFHVCDFIDREGAQAYILRSHHDLIIVARGTEPNQWDDLRADANAMPVLLDIGRVHAGFHGEVDHLWPLVEESIRDNRLPTYFTGHSLGAAMAMVLAGRCKKSNIYSNPRALFTFGSPRVGNNRYIHYVDLTHYRWVNNNDIVTRIPPRWLGYRHSGYELYIDHTGRLRRVFSWTRSLDRFKGLLQSLRRGKLDYLADHSMVEYILNIRRCLAEYREGAKLPTPKIKLQDG